MMVTFRVQAQDTFKVSVTQESDSVPVKSFDLTFDCHSETQYEEKDIKLNLSDGKYITAKTITDHKLYTLGWCYYKEVANSGEMDSYYLQEINPVVDGFYQYYYKNGKISRDGYYKDREKSGKWISWYPNGQKMSEGAYYDGFKIGKWQTWYPNGNICSGESYIDDIPFIDAIRKDGLFKHIRFYNEDQLPVISCYKDKELYLNKSMWFFPNGQVSSLENWSITLLGIEQWTEKGKKISMDFQNRYAYLKVLPKFNGDIYSFFRRKLKIKSKTLRELKLIEVSYKITKEGKLKDIEVIQPEKSEYQANIVNAVQEMDGKWSIAKQHNLPQNVKYDLTVFLN
jgi:antitoxin component YwqK of YwqJK toxin-antitoxin module